MAQYIEIASTDMRKVVETLLELGLKGAYLDNSCPAFKVGPLFTTKVVIEDDSDVNYSQIVRKVPTKVDNGPAKVVNVSLEASSQYTRDQLEQMTLAEVRKATGIKEGGKAEIVEKYLSEAEKKE